LCRTADSNISDVPFERIASGIPFNDSKPGFVRKRRRKQVSPNEIAKLSFTRLKPELPDSRTQRRLG
jgi:hypothetical protein